jgi:hypothetical protein
MQLVPIDIVICLALFGVALGWLWGFLMRPKRRPRIPDAAYFGQDYSRKPELRAARKVA